MQRRLLFFFLINTISHLFTIPPKWVQQRIQNDKIFALHQKKCWLANQQTTKPTSDRYEYLPEIMTGFISLAYLDAIKIVNAYPR